MSDDIVVKLDLDSSGLRTELESSRRALDRLTSTVNRANQKVDTHADSWKAGSIAIKGWLINVGLAMHAFDNLARVADKVVGSVIRVNSEFERLQVLMRGLSRQEGGGFQAVDEEATSQFEYLIDLARRSPFELNAMTESFVRLKSAGLEPLTEAFDTLIDSAARYGRTGDELKRAAIAIQQMVGKGVISMEELRQQLGEAIPTAMQSMARGMRITMGELAKIVSTGTLKSEEALERMFEQMKLESEGAALYMSRTFAGTWERMVTNLKMLALEMGNTGFFDEIKNQLTAFTDEFLRSEDAMKTAVYMGQQLTKVATSIKKVILLAIEYKDEIIILTKVVVSYIAVIGTLKVANYAAATSYKVLASAANLAWRALGAALIGYGNWVTKIRATGSVVALMGFNSVAIRGLVTSLTSLTGIMAAIKAGLGIFATGLGLVFIKLTALIGVVYLLYKAWKKLKGLFGDENEELIGGINKSIKAQTELTEKQFKNLSDAIIRKGNELAELQKKIQLQSQAGQDGRGSRGGNTYLHRLRRLAEEAGAELIKLQATMRKAQNMPAMAAASRSIEEYTQDVNKYLLTARNKLANYTTWRIRENRRIADSSIDSEEQMQKDIYSATVDFIDMQIGAYENLQATNKAHLDRMTKNEAAYGQEAVDNMRNVVSETSQTIQRLEEQRLSVERYVKPVLIAGADKKDGDKDQDKTLKYWAQLKVRLEGARAKLAQLNVEAAKTRERFDVGMIDPNHEKAKEIHEMADALGIVTTKIKDQTKALKIQDQAQQRIADVMSFIQAQSFKSSNRNPFLAAGQQASFFHAQLKKLNEKLLEAKDILGDDFRSELLDQVIDLSSQTDLMAAQDGIRKMTDALEEYSDSLLSNDDATKASFQRQREYVDQFVLESGDTLDEGMRKIVEKYRKSLDHMEYLQTNAVGAMMLEWKKMNYGLDDMFADMFEGMADSLTEFVMTGKMDMQSFLEDIERMLISSAIKKLIAEMFAMMAASSFGQSMGMSFSAQGNIVDSSGPRALKRYAQGGVADRPHVAIFGEGDTPEAFVPLPDGRTIPVTLDAKNTSTTEEEGGNMVANVMVNVINESGQAVEGEEAGSRFDGEKMIVDVVLKKLNGPGPLRDTVKGMR